MFRMSSPSWKTTFDWAAVGISAGAIIEVLPAIAALLSILWTLWRFYVEIKERIRFDKMWERVRKTRKKEDDDD